MTITHESVATPDGVVAPRFRPPAGASSAAAVSLDGEWRFRLFPHPDTGVHLTEPGDDWDRVSVPGHWQLAGAPQSWPYGTPAYTNVLYPFPVEPPHVPDDNPTGEYRTTLRLPADWPDGGRTLLRFEGVDSWFQVALDGELLATSHGSRLPTEVDLTDRLRSGGEHLLAIRVTQWSAMSYIEDQDQWWLSGIFRSVSLEHRPDGALDDVRVHAEYDHTTGVGTLRVDAATVVAGPGAVAARVVVPELGIEAVSGEELRAAVEPWSAELPRLYDVVVSTDTETVTLAVGFRTVSIEDGVFLVNGRPIKLRGVNRHEFDPLRGRSVTPERMLEDVLLMKRHHINAVRTSHYPPHPHFLDLCDRHGLYVIDENDLETHGFEVDGWVGNPVDDPDWTEVLVDRVTRMVCRDAHHASIIMWSLGNEAGIGRNVPAMADAVRALDPSRPIHYERDYSSEHVDVYSRMYADVAEVELIGQGIEPPFERADADAHRRAQPFLQCEYAHAMGNGPGGLADYDALFDRYPRLLGGFVWEWIDHGLTRTDADGVEFAAYGGDFGERLHDGTFIADGLLLPDRTPSPGLLETAAVYAPIRIDAQPDGSLLVRNRYVFRDTSHAELRWTLHRGAEELAAGVVLDLVLGAGAEAVVRPPSGLHLPEPGDAPVWWTLRAVQQKADTLEDTWLEPGFELGAGQLLLVEPAPLAAPAGRVTTEADGGFVAGPARFDSRGHLRELAGRAVHDFRVDAWRAPTDNDIRPGREQEQPDAQLWYRAGLTLLGERIAGVEIGDDGVLEVATRVAGPAIRTGFATRYRWQPVTDAPDAVDLLVDIRPEGPTPQSVARLGVLLALDEPRATEAGVRWTGLGPDESYADSKRAALGGAWLHTVADWQTRYTHPQENGARRGVTSAALSFADGSGLRIDAGEVTIGGRPQVGFELSLRPWSDEALDRAAHPHELVPDGRLWLHLDAAQHGVGSAACGPGVLPNAQLHAAPVRMRVRFTAL